MQGIMEASAQSLRMTRLSGRRDMSTLLAQSAFSVKPCMRAVSNHGRFSPICGCLRADWSGYFNLLARLCMRAGRNNGFSIS